MKDKSQLQVGDTLFFVPAWRSHHVPEDSVGSYDTIEKVGRKWLTMKSGHRVDKEMLTVDGGEYTSPGRCYLSQEQYAEEESIRRMFAKLRDALSSHRQPVAGVTAEDIIMAAKLLGLKTTITLE